MAKHKDFELETILEYKNNDGSRGWFVKVKNKKPKIENKVIKNILPALNNQKLSMTNSTSYLKNRIKKIFY